MAQAKDKEKFKGRNVGVLSLSSDDVNKYKYNGYFKCYFSREHLALYVNTSINTKDNDGSKCFGKCNKIAKDESKAVCCDYCSL